MGSTIDFGRIDMVWVVCGMFVDDEGEGWWVLKRDV